LDSDNTLHPLSYDPDESLGTDDGSPGAPLSMIIIVSGQASEAPLLALGGYCWLFSLRLRLIPNNALSLIQSLTVSNSLMWTYLRCSLLSSALCLLALQEKSVFSGLNEFRWFSASRRKSHGSFESHKDVAENNFMFPFVEYMIIFYSFYSLVAKNLMPPKFFEICTARVAPLPTLSPHALSRSDVSQSSHHPPQRAASALCRPTPCTATAFIRRSSSVRRCHPRSLICMPPPPSASPPAAGPWTTAPPVIGDQLSCCF
jgi:hypothetical protein